MTRHLPTIAGALMGLVFAASGAMFLLGIVPDVPDPPEGSPLALFMGAFGPTGYMAFVKVLELAGGILVAIPRTRRLGLLVLGPIIVNILAFLVFIAGGEGLFEPMVLLVVVLAAFLLWWERRAFMIFLSGSETT